MAKMSELPIGVYYDKTNQVIVTGHQKGLGAGMFFGVLGVVVVDQMNKSSGSTKFGAEAAKSAATTSLPPNSQFIGMLSPSSQYVTVPPLPCDR